VAIAEVTASTHVKREALVDGAACAAAQKNKVAQMRGGHETFAYRAIPFRLS
jgi:hypothetical protein